MMIVMMMVNVVMMMVDVVMMMMVVKVMMTDLAESNSLSTGGAARTPLVDDEAVGKMRQKWEPDFFGGKVKIGASELKTCHNLVQDITRC